VNTATSSSAVNPSTAVIRPSIHPNNQISFLWTPGSVLLETVYVPGSGLRFLVREASGATSVVQQHGVYTLLPWLEAFARSNTVRLAAGATPFGSFDQLASDMRAFVRRYFDCDADFEAVAVLYALHTWIADACQAVPYLRFLGLWG